MGFMRRALFLLLWLLSVSASAAAQSWRYESWDSPDDRSQQLVEELRKLIEEAERVRAADPRFLWDLRTLARRYDRPWQVELLRDDFSDGDYGNGPVWTVRAGRFFVDRSLGLRSTVAVSPTPAAPSQGTVKGGGQQDLASTILGAILEQSLGQRREGRTRASAPAARAEIVSGVRISNAFAIRIELTSWRGEGRLELGPYTAQGVATGYRLVYLPGGQPGLQLVRIAPGSLAVIDVYRDSLPLEDRQFHVLSWTRDRAGEMTVTVDGNEVLRTTDRAIAAPFDGVTVTNLGGDFAVRSIRVMGTDG